MTTAKWKAKRVYVSLSAQIMAALKSVPRATVPKIAEDIGKEKTAVYRHLRGLLQVELIEEAGRLEWGRKPMTYRIHEGVRSGAGVTDELRKERDELLHDVEQYIRIASEEADRAIRAERVVAALKAALSSAEATCDPPLPPDRIHSSVRAQP